VRQIASKGCRTGARIDRAYERCKRTSFASTRTEGLLGLYLSNSAMPLSIPSASDKGEILFMCNTKVLCFSMSARRQTAGEPARRIKGVKFPG